MAEVRATPEEQLRAHAKNWVETRRRSRDAYIRKDKAAHQAEVSKERQEAQALEKAILLFIEI